MDISRDELKHLIESKSNYILIDVRNKNELVYGMIPTAHHIPLLEIKEALNMSEPDFEEKYHFKKPTKNDNIIYYCKSGGRSEIATEKTLSMGYKARNYAGSTSDWAEIDQNVKKYDLY